MTAETLAIIVKGFPRVSESFITHELRRLELNGLRFSLAALRNPGLDAPLAKGHGVSVSVNYLPEYLHREPLRVIRGIFHVFRMPGFSRAIGAFLRDVMRDPSINRVRRFGQACALASDLSHEIKHLHAHFIHTPASVARYAAMLRNLTFSISAHAKDIWTISDWELSEKLAEARFCSVCNDAGFQRLNAAAANQSRARIYLWPHTHAILRAQEPRHWSPEMEIRLVTVARAMPKKGLDLLLDALGKISSDRPWSWTHIGGGPESTRLKSMASTHPYKERLRFLGPLPHAETMQILAQSDIFVLTAVVAGNGDRDGRPNALIEAMQLGLACIATQVGGIPEIATNEENALLIEPSADDAARALVRLLHDDDLRAKLGRAAKTRSIALAQEGEMGLESLTRALREASGQA